VTNGIDFSGVTFSNAFLLGPGSFKVDGSANITANTLSLGTGTTNVATVGSINMAANASVPTPANGYGRAGIPDIIVCHKGKFLAIECKAGYNKTTLLQEREIVNIHKAGGAAIVVREDTIDALERWFEESE
jgi:hypothetical protein